MSDKSQTSLGTWIILFVTLFNLVALVCLAVYQLRLNKELADINVSKYEPRRKPTCAVTEDG